MRGVEARSLPPTPPRGARAPAVVLPYPPFVESAIGGKRVERPFQKSVAPMPLSPMTRGGPSPGTSVASAHLVSYAGKELQMSMSISRLSVGSPEMEQGLRSILEEMGAPEGADWTASFTRTTASSALDIVFDADPR